jgi:ribosome recycling factor
MNDDTLVGAALEDSRDKMHKVVEHTKSEFAGVRTGRANPGLVDKLKVDYYGSEVVLQQLASFTVPEARMLVVHPFDKGALKAIEKAIQLADLGINPSNDGELIRLVFPQLTEERRRELVKLARQRAEEGRVSVRNVRRAARHELETLERDGDITADDLEWGEKELDRLTHELTAEIDRLLAHKEHELLEV